MKKLILLLSVFLLLFAVSAQATQLSEIKTKVRNYLHETDTTNTNYDDTMTVEAVNTSIEYLINTMPPSCHYNLLVTKSEVGPGGSWALSTTFKYVLSAQYNLSTTSVMIQLNPTNFLVGKDRATLKDPAFFIADSTIYVYPALTIGQQIQYLYLRQPAKMVNPTDIIPLLPIYDEEIVLGAVIHILNLDNQPIRSAAVEKYLANQLAGITAIMTGKNVPGK